MAAGKRILAGCMLLVPCLFLAGALWLQGEVIASSGQAAVPASSDNWGLSFPVEGEPPVGNATAEELAQYDASYVGDTKQKVIYLTFDCGYEIGCTEKILDAGGVFCSGAHGGIGPGHCQENGGGRPHCGQPHLPSSRYVRHQ